MKDCDSVYVVYFDAANGLKVGLERSLKIEADNDLLALKALDDCFMKAAEDNNRIIVLLGMPCIFK